MTCNAEVQPHTADSMAVDFHWKTLKKIQQRTVQDAIIHCVKPFTVQREAYSM